MEHSVFITIFYYLKYRNWTQAGLPDIRLFRLLSNGIWEVVASTVALIFPVSIWTLNFSNIGPEQCFDGWMLGNSWCCWHMIRYWYCLEASGQCRIPAPVLLEVCHAGCFLEYSFYKRCNQCNREPKNVAKWSRVKFYQATTSCLPKNRSSIGELRLMHKFYKLRWDIAALNTLCQLLIYHILEQFNQVFPEQNVDIRVKLW